MTVSHATGDAGAWLNAEACLWVAHAVKHEIKRLPPTRAAILKHVSTVIEPVVRAYAAERDPRVSATGSRTVPQPEANGNVARMTTRDAADAIGISARQVTNHLHAGSLDGERIGGHWLIDPASVERFVEARR